MQNKTVHWRQDHNDSDDDDESPRVIITSNYRALESCLDFLAPGCLVVHVVGYDDALINKKAIQSESSSRPIYKQAGWHGRASPPIPSSPEINSSGIIEFLSVVESLGAHYGWMEIKIDRYTHWHRTRVKYSDRHWTWNWYANPTIYLYAMPPSPAASAASAPAPLHITCKVSRYYTKLVNYI